MRTPDISDEELDRLFQRGAEAFPDEAPMAGWLRLETQLEEITRQQLQRRQLWQRVAGLFVAELAVVVLFLSIWLMPDAGGLGQSGRPEPSSTTTSNEVINPRNEAHIASSPSRSNRHPELGLASHEIPLGQLASVAEHGVATSEAFGTAANSSVRSGRPLRISRAKMPFAGVASLAAGSSRPYRLVVVSSAEKPTAVQIGEQFIPAGGLAVPMTDIPSRTEAPPVSAAIPFAPDSTATAACQEVAPAVPSVLTSPADSSQPPPRPKRPAYRLLVGVVGGPELSAVLPSPSLRTGGTVGAVVEYRLTDRLRVRTGLLRSVKRYGARGSDYRPPAGYWTWKTPIEEVDANCRILEIPLDFRYDLLPRATYSFYASAGLTSLVLRNERYTYHYELNGQYLERTWSRPNGGNQALQMLRLAAGYERSVAPRWVLQAEPFVNVPLSGVGFGRMRLSSTGLLFGLRYGLGRAPASKLAP